MSAAPLPRTWTVWFRQAGDAWFRVAGPFRTFAEMESEFAAGRLQMQVTTRDGVRVALVRAGR